MARSKAKQARFDRAVADLKKLKSEMNRLGISVRRAEVVDGSVKKSTTPHWMIEDSHGQRLLNFWPTSGTVDGKQTVSGFPEAFEVASRKHEASESCKVPPDQRTWAPHQMEPPFEPNADASRWETPEYAKYSKARQEGGMTFVRTEKPTKAACSWCGKRITGVWYFNWKKDATVKFLDEDCYHIYSEENGHVSDLDREYQSIIASS